MKGGWKDINEFSCPCIVGVNQYLSPNKFILYKRSVFFFKFSLGFC